jgi:hypothetical protein
MARPFDLDRPRPKIDAAYPHRRCFRRPHAGEEQGVEEREIRIVLPRLLGAHLPPLRFEVVQNLIPLLSRERRRAWNYLLPPPHFRKRERCRDIILPRVAHHCAQRSADSLSASGDSVANFSLATTERFKDRSGARQERTEWHRMTGLQQCVH